ncbi:MAG: chemotaxis protein CheW [Bacteroidetes bacterium]|nr:chemotaxis protein CheW [Bacteroidota bacterium]
MLYLIFEMNAQLYAINSKEILEIIPNVNYTVIPNAPGFVKGIFNYRGTAVPVIDLLKMASGKSTPEKLSTKIMIVNFSPLKTIEKTIGLLTENIVGSEHIAESAIKKSGLNIDEAKYLGDIINQSDKMIQLIDVNNLLSKEVQKILFSAEI